VSRGVPAPDRPDSPAASEYVVGRAVTGGEARVRAEPPVAVVIHTTGGGPVKRVRDDDFAGWRKRWPEYATSAFLAAKWVYTIASPDSGHYLLGQAGECIQVVPEDLVARHVGAAESKAYADGRWMRPEYAWWKERWPGLTSPVELAGGKLWRGGSCNGASIGIEVAPNEDDPTGPWSNACWAALVTLVSDVCLRNEIPCTRTHVVTHSDAHPIARTSKGVGWDPGPRQWSWAEYARSAGAPF
jgi:hypothetical protein